MDKWHDPYVGISAQEDATQSEVQQFISASYGDFETGDLNASDIISRITMMEEYGLQGTDENATFSDVTASLAALGLEHPNLAETGYMNVSYNASDGYRYENRKGMLFARNDPDGDWATNGTTYDSGNVEGPVMFVRQDGEQFTINGSFTIHSATAKDGSDVETVTTEDVDYQVANTTELQTLLQDIADAQENITVHTDSSGGSSSGGIDWPDWGASPGDVFGGIAAMAVILLGVIAVVKR
jgi:hypothetical protein